MLQVYEHVALILTSTLSKGLWKETGYSEKFYRTPLPKCQSKQTERISKPPPKCQIKTPISVAGKLISELHV